MRRLGGNDTEAKWKHSTVTPQASADFLSGFEEDVDNTVSSNNSSGTIQVSKPPKMGCGLAQRGAIKVLVYSNKEKKLGHKQVRTTVSQIPHMPISL